MTVKELLEILNEEVEQNKYVLDYDIYFEEGDGYEAFVYSVDIENSYGQVVLS